MSIIGVRIDGRLIHGQVANLWTTKLNITRIMVVDDEVAKNDIEKTEKRLENPIPHPFLNLFTSQLEKVKNPEGGFFSYKFNG